MKETVRVALVQLDIVGLDPERNLAHMREMIHKAVSQGPVDLIVFPELCDSGYVSKAIAELGPQLCRISQKIPGPFSEGLSEEAKRHEVYIVAGLLEAHPTIPLMMYNAAVLIDPSGKLAGVHHKMHIAGEERHYFCAGNTADVFSTELGIIGIQVCMDGSFPELSRVYALKGAEIICTVYNVPKRAGMDFLLERIYHQACCRAIENVGFYIGCNRVGSDEGGTFSGHSCVAGPMGQILAWSETDQEEIIMAMLKEEDLRIARSVYPYFKDRRPEHYGILTLTLEQLAHLEG